MLPKMASSQVQDTEMFVYLPTFCLKNVNARTCELQGSWVFIRIITVGPFSYDMAHFDLLSYFYFRHFSTNEVSLFSLDVAKNVNHVIDVILQDVGGNSTEVCQEALQVLGVCLHDQDIVRYKTFLR